MKATCYKCDKRHLGCHDRCTSYLDAKKAIEKPDKTGDYQYSEYFEIAAKRMKRTGSFRRNIVGWRG